MLRLLLFVAAAAGFVVVDAPAAHAQTVSCSAQLNGQDVANHRSAGKAIHVRYSQSISVRGSSASTVSDVRYWIKVAGMKFSLGENFVTSDTTWSGDVNIKDYAWAGVGLYEVVGEARTANGVCRDRVFVCVGGRSPFATAAGGIATLSGLLGLVALLRAKGRGARATAGAMTGFGGVVLLQQFCVLPIAPMTMAIIPIGAVLAGTVGIVHGRGIPVPMTPPVTPPVVTPQPEQPRTQAKNIYQFRASAKACTACKNHAQNKVYASAEAMKRPHKGCHCTIDWRPVDEGAYAAYFQKGPEYDPRKP